MKEFISQIVKESKTIVNETNTAKSVGSGVLEVFSTPMMLALMEKATCLAADELLEDGETSVGTKIDISHDKASPLNDEITATATLTSVDRRKLIFSVVAKNSKNEIIGSGTIERFVVNAKSFMEKVNV